MKIEATSVGDYINQLPPERKEAIIKLREVILKNLPHGFVEEINYGMIGYVVPHSIYPSGYHCDPNLPLPFMNIANQKNFIGFYHMGIYSQPELHDWFINTWPNHSSRKLDMGKSCVRLKKIDEIPYELIGELASKMTPEKWIEIYEAALKK